MSENSSTKSTNLHVFQLDLVDELLGEFMRQYSITTLLGMVSSFVGDAECTYQFRNEEYRGILSDIRKMTSDLQMSHQLTITLTLDKFAHPMLSEWAFLLEMDPSLSEDTTLLHEVKTKSNIVQIQQQCNATHLYFLYQGNIGKMNIEFRDNQQQILLKIIIQEGLKVSPRNLSHYVNLL